MAVPRRSAFCLQCRTALLDEEACDQDAEHPAVSMDDVYARETLIAAVWGPVRERGRHLSAGYRRQNRLSALTALGAAAGAMTAALLTQDMIAVWAGGLASGTAFRTWARRALASSQPEYPVGARPLRWPPGHGPEGVIHGDTTLTAPASTTACLAYALELRHEIDGDARVMYRDAVCTNMTVTLNSGDTVRIPAGRIRLGGTMHQEVDVDNVSLEHHLRDFDPHRKSDATFEPLRYNVVYEQVLLPGDHIEIAGALDPVAGTETVLYREAAPCTWVPRGVPALRVVTGGH